MNIFWLDHHPVQAAMYMCDKHVIKMALESAQMLCAPFEDGQAPYRRAYYNHPCTKWARESQTNYDWLTSHALALCEEYERRYEKEHGCLDVIEWCDSNRAQLKLSKRGLTKPAQAMPDWYKDENPVKAYRSYYMNEKAYFASWDRAGSIPEWWKPQAN